MAGPLKIIAMADPKIASLNGEDLESDRDRLGKVAARHGYRFISTYNSLNQLITLITAELQKDQDCLSVLEINAHGNPTLCDGVTMADVAAFGNQLKSLNLCDIVDIYLSGCNTGVNDNGGPSIAQALSKSAPTIAGDNVQCTVYGSVGYLSGTNAEGNGDCSVEVTLGRGKKKRYFAPYPPSKDGTQPGSKQARGKRCYRGFREGKAI